ncbi:Bug family tripartite tricarboxylate transporter substrate binding protein [Hydrogenophaga sp. OTU3427]|uniref:Bug family tripartite tricarboxylate transporter substrate binding protein n=1 Tax=Hydrogenophaga sp. OTU3427 TaxID=3043856 RepID=UPI00313BD17E
MQTLSRRSLPAHALVLALAALPFTAALAQTNWPTRTVTLVSPYNPGGTNDIPARILADGFQRIFGQSFIVKNVAGAAGVVGTQQVMNAAADGYTLLSTNIGAMVVQPVVKTPAPYDPVNHFTSVAKITDAHAFLGVSGDLPVNNVGELVALAKKTPGQLNYSSSGSGSFGNFVGEYFKLLTGTDIVHIPGKGSAGAVMEMKAGRIQLMFDPLVLPQAADGRIKALAVVSKTRLPTLPNMPTVKEAGGPELGITAWFGLFGPAHLPKDIVAKLEAATEKVLADPETRKKLLDLGLSPNYQGSAAFRAELEGEMKLFTDVRTRAKLSVE